MTVNNKNPILPQIINELLTYSRYQSYPPKDIPNDKFVIISTTAGEVVVMDVNEMARLHTLEKAASSIMQWLPSAVVFVGDETVYRHDHMSEIVALGAALQQGYTND